MKACRRKESGGRGGNGRGGNSVAKSFEITYVVHTLSHSLMFVFPSENSGVTAGCLDG